VIDRTVAVGVDAVVDPVEHVEAVRARGVAADRALLAPELHQDRGVVDQLGTGRLVDVGVEFQRYLSVRSGIDQHVPGPVGDRSPVDWVSVATTV
jgi:hypothetical protein